MIHGNMFILGHIITHNVYEKQISDLLPFPWGFPGGTVVKNRLSMQEPWVRSLGWEDPLEEEMATHSSILAWRIPWTEEPGGLQSMGLQKVGND